MHDGIGYFIDLDHAAVLAVNTTSTYSPGTGTMPYISIWILQSMMKMIDPNVDNNDPSKDVALANAVERLIEHRPSDDLESLFYIFFEFVAKYGGAHGELAPSWTRDSLPWGLWVPAISQKPLVQHWQALVCLTNKPDEKERVETTHDKVLEVLTAFIDTYVEVAPINPSASSNPIPEVGSGGDNPRVGRPPIPEAGPSRLPLRRSTRNLHKSC
ncbi:uncharacterized protein F5147DRAFT_776004 [Suillus discolor]|uniref:Fungal-type protein kinase domain-containing protein n=1 Tax=Suillus discolor TaxID=1912936 RepID=A0A9P7F228_9AGAM|nr:uncharacterized protein F5147DRAFT_776004 [Suillus discolor]KAG2103461.1 hypothetical protein F5147DRAFT_776004 [Suillus discolor]